MSEGEHDRRLIEDYLPIATINELAQREKTGHIAAHPRKLHLWWARRPLAAARAAVYAALVPADGRDPEEDAGLFAELCRWDASETALRRARAEILAANGGRPPRVLDLFAGGGAIPLEAARLGCEATAVELNPVAHLIERCMLEYPQRFPGLAEDVREWGHRWVERAWERLADLYPPVESGPGQQGLFDRQATDRGTSRGGSPSGRVPMGSRGLPQGGTLPQEVPARPGRVPMGSRGLPQEDPGRRPLAYLWTRTVRCPNPALPEHRVPLVRQTWLARKQGRYIALRPVVDRGRLEIGWEVVEADSPDGLGFDPGAWSKRGEASCLICGAMVSGDHVKAEGTAGRLGIAPLAAVVLKPSGRGRDYLAAGSYPLPDEAECRRRLEQLEVQPPEEPLVVGKLTVSVPLYGLTRFCDLFTPRQLLTLCTLAQGVREVHQEMLADGMEADRARAVATYLALSLSRLFDYESSLCHWDPIYETVINTFARQALPMVWDFAEVMPFGDAAGDIAKYLETTSEIMEILEGITLASVIRSSADALPLESESQDAVITDPPYYDNISYADLSDFFYVWLKRSIGHLYPEDLGGELTPKRKEFVVAPYRHHGDKAAARRFYETSMAQSFAEAHRVLKPGGPLVCIYAHKTTLGWSTLVEALRQAGFTITEAWPLDTEMPQRSVGQGTASLASSIFLVARKREAGAGVGREAQVMRELEGLVAERLERLRKAGVTGSDLVIAILGAALRAFTRFERVERDNGEPLLAEQFLVRAQRRVLDAIFGDLGGADAITRFYLAGQFSYGYGQVAFDELNNLARATGVELDGPRGLTGGPNPLVRKQGSTVQLRDFEARGEDSRLGLPSETGMGPAALIDVAQGLLWRAEHRRGELKEYLAQAHPDVALLRRVMQALAGAALRTGAGDGKAPEQQAAERLLGSWRYVVEENLLV